MTNVYLLGAGFTRAVLGDRAPLTHELMQKLDVSNYPEIQNEYEKSFPNIEEFTSIVDLKILRFRQTNSSLFDRFNSIKEEIVRQIVSLVDVDALQVNELDLAPLLQDFVGKIPYESRILMLNYDCVLDQGLWLSRRWSPHGGYYLSSSLSNDNENNSKERILLLKLHGS